MKAEKSEIKGLPDRKENPFRVPDGYFDNLSDRVMDRIRMTEEQNVNSSRKIYLRPYLSLAASISGLALVVYIVMQSIVGSRDTAFSSLDISVLESNGIIQDELIVAESYTSDDEASYSEWEEDAINYLASNDAELYNLLESN